MTAVEPQAATGTREQLVRQLNGLGGLEVAGQRRYPGAVTVRLLAETLEAATHVLAGTTGIRLADMFADNDR